MNCAKNQRSEQSVKNAIALLIVVAVLWLLSLCVGCTTVTPHTVNSSAYSFDGTNQNSGVIGFVGEQVEVTPHWRDRYNAMISVYSKRFLPPLAPDYGLTPTATNTFLVTPEAYRDFLKMNRWRKVDAVKN